MDMRNLFAAACAACFVVSSGCGQQSDRVPDGSGVEQVQDSKIVVGAELPEFELSSLEDVDISISRADVAGKVYLIDFWATWCLPCVAELPNLHRAYDTYASRGFEILSIAMGDRREDIARLRATELSMPWLHAFEPLDSEVATLFELYGVPMAILVDSNHTIIGIDEDVRGERLQETLAQLYVESN